MSSRSVEPDRRGGSTCQDQYLSKITGKGKTLFKSLKADDTQLVQKFETLWGAEYAPNNDILYQRSNKLDRLNNSKSVAGKRDAGITNKQKKKQKKRLCSTGQLKLLPCMNKCIFSNNPVSLYVTNSSLASKTYSKPNNKSADDLKKRLLEAEKRILIDHGPFRLNEG